MGKATRILLAMAMLLLTMGMAAPGYANDDDLDNYKFRINAEWWFSQPGGYFGLASSNNYIDFHRDFGFGSYSTFTGKVDWHFKHKHHFLFDASPVNRKWCLCLKCQSTFQAQTPFPV